MSFATYLTTALLIAAIAIFARGAKSRAAALAFGMVAWLSIALLVVHQASDYFTGEGINEAAWFHVRYGFGGAGLGDYRGVIGWSIAALLGPALFLGWLGRRRDRPPAAASQWRLAIGLAASSLVVNPATGELVKLATPPPPQTADFVRHYRAPTLTAVAPEHPNFVFIYAESLERTYFNETIFPGLIKELRALEAEGTSFTDIQTVYGTGFTMGGIVGSLCGVPLFTPANPNSMSGMDNFLPGAVGLSDLLHDEGYYLAFMGGAHLTFAGKGKFFKTHQFDETAGFPELHSRVSDRSYISAWGLYDDTLLDFAYDRFEQLAREKPRFGLFLLTLDTHHPDGHISRAAAGIKYGDGSNPILNAVAASDHLLAQFIRRLQASPHGRNTVIVVASDHIAMHNTAAELLAKAPRRNLLLVIDPRRAGGTKVTRAGSTLDTGSTLLPFLGYKGVIGLGRDLLDPLVSDAELAHIRDEKSLLSWRDELSKFWGFPHFRTAITFSENPASIAIDGRQFSAPVLVQLEDRSRTTLRFEFDAVWDIRLAQQAERLAPGTAFLLFAPTEDVRALLPTDGPALDSRWVLVVGKAGKGQMAVPLRAGARISKREIDQYLGRW